MQRLGPGFHGVCMNAYFLSRVVQQPAFLHPVQGEAHYWATCADDVGEILLGEQYLKRKTVSTRHIESKSKIVQRARQPLFH